MPDRGLVALAVLAPLSVLAAGRFPPAALVANILLGAAAIGWALTRSSRAWAGALGSGAVVVGVLIPAVLPSYLAGALAGPVVREVLRRGGTPRAALSWGVVPAVGLSIVMAMSGFQPVPEDVEKALDELLGDPAIYGDLPAESVVELRESTQTAVEVLRRTWVASEAIWLWGSLVVAWIGLRRLVRTSRIPRLGRFSRLDLPDATVWVLIAGLSAVLLGGREDGGGIVALVGWNAVAGTGFAFTLRGIAIESFWMQRAKLSKAVRISFFAGGVLLFLPVFLVVAAGLGLFDTWFDFRRVRESGTGSHPFSFLQRSSGDDPDEKE